MGRGDRFNEPRFSNPVCSKKLTDKDYELAVGLRCPDCEALWEECVCDPTHYRE